MIILMTVTLWLSVFLLRINFVNAVECRAMSIKYEPKDLLILKNCTSILGSLTIASIEDLYDVDIINQYQFPNLKEITGYLLLFNVKGLTSPGNLFPNLTVIRGKQLFQSYSLIIFNNPHMTKVDFKSLISIQRGYVLIEQCPTLCYHNTVDWEALTDEDEDDLIVGKGNVIQQAASKCPTRESCRACDNDYCWSAYNCQKNKQSHFKKGVMCHKLCLGGCVNGTAEGCNVCSKLKVNGTCVEECPSDLFIFRDTMRCITKQKCVNGYKLIPFNGECRRQCPVSFSGYHPVTNQFHPNECFKCEIKCPKRCLGLEIRGPTELEYLRECTIVDGSLSIRLGLNMTDIYEKLEETLGNIEIINGALKIHRSFSLTSLSFFRNLIKINAQNATLRTKGDDSYEFPNPYAIEVTENDNLQTLFNWKEKQQFEITGGGMSFHFNSKLCVNEIHNLQNITTYDRTHDSIGYDTNGYDEICHATGIFAEHVVHSHSNVQIFWNISDFGPNRRLIGYFVYYIEAPSHNISYFYGLDACSTTKFRHSPSKDLDMPMISKKPHGDVWQSVFVPFEDLKKEQGFFQMNITGLKQYTQYAYYVRTQLSLKHKDQVINVTQGQSQVKYFKTLPDRPRPPIVRTKEKTNVSVTLEWFPSTPEHEFVQKYFIDVYALVDDVNEIDKRNYCHNPKVNAVEDDDDVVVKTPEEICCRDQRAYLEFFQRENNQTCGKSDPNCEKTFEFVLFHHHVESALLKADLDKDPSERYQHKRESYESPIHHRGTIDPIKRKNDSDTSKYYLHSHIIDDKHTDSVFVPNLKPFNLYAFYVYACNNVSNCSDYYFHSDRTKPYINADDISVLAVPEESRTDIVTLIVQPPAEPNAVTVAYQIERYDYLRNIVKVECITRKDMDNMNYTVRFENLLHGSYSFRMRIISIGQDGDFSDWVIVEVEKLSNDKYNWGIALTFICIFIIIILVIVCRKVKNFQSPRIRDIDYLLSERRDSEHSTLQQPTTNVTEPPKRKRIQPSDAWQQSHSTQNVEDQQQRRPLVPEGIPMTVFKSNVSTSTLSLDQPSTSNDPIPTTSSSELSVLESTTRPSKSIVKRLLESIQGTTKKDDPPHQIEKKDSSTEDGFLSRSLEREQNLTDDSDYDFSLFD